MKTLISMALFFVSTMTLAYDAHEWGTFTSVVGTDGKIIQGLHHEEEALPNFVYDLSRVENRRVKTKKNDDDEPGGDIPLPPTTRGYYPRSMDRMPIPTFTERITQKMETPVIYFYSDKKVDVNVRVDFPNGIVSQWFPKACIYLFST